MNRIYKVIWSKVKNCYVVVSEIAKRNSKSTVNSGFSVTRNILAGAVVLGLTAGVCAPVWAAANINTSANITYTIVDGNDVEAQMDGNNIKLNIKKINIGNGNFTVAENGTVTAHGNTIIDANGNLTINSIGDYKVNGNIITVGTSTATGQYAKSIGSGTTAMVILAQHGVMELQQKGKTPLRLDLIQMHMVRVQLHGDIQQSQA